MSADFEILALIACLAQAKRLSETVSNSPVRGKVRKASLKTNNCLV